MVPRYTSSGYHPAVSPLPQPLDGPCLSTGRGAPRTSVPAYCCHNRCLQHGLGRYMQWAGSLGGLDRAPTALAHQLPRAVGSASSLMAVTATAVGQARVTHSPEWQIHPKTIQLIWSRFGDSALGIDALAHSRPPSLRKYAFPPVILLAQTLCKLREDKEQVLLVAPHWPTRTWFPELISLVTAPPWRIPLRKDLLSQGLCTIWHPRPDLWNLHYGSWTGRGRLERSTTGSGRDHHSG